MPPKRRGKYDYASRRRRRRGEALAPPPPPPKELVELLQSNGEVFSYFQSLQSNLQADVKRWKERAAVYKEKCYELEAQLSCNESPATQINRKTRKPEHSSKKSTNNQKRRPSTARESFDLHARGHQQDFARSSNKVDETRDLGTIPIDDGIFDFSDDSSVDSFTQKTRCESRRKERKKSFDNLREAFTCLKKLGVVLTSESIKKSTLEVEESAETSLEMDATKEGNETVSLTLERLADQDVVANLMQALRSLSRVHLLMKKSKEYHPFSMAKLTPSYFRLKDEESSPHPAEEGLALAFRALSIMHSFCGDYVDSEWDLLFSGDCGSDSVAMKIGLRNRRSAVELFVSSMQGEISSSWASLDRLSRHDTTAFHFNGNESAEPGHDQEDEAFLGHKSQSQLAYLLERCIHAQLVSKLLYSSKNLQEAANLVESYVLSTTPSLGVEEYPKFPPVLSLCVLEALLRCRSLSRKCNTITDSSWFARFLQKVSPKGAVSASQALGLSIHSAAAIWHLRSVGTDDRISGIAKVEVACYERLLKSESSWLLGVNEFMSFDRVKEEAMALIRNSFDLLTNAAGNLDSVGEGSDVSQSNIQLDVSIALPLAFVLVGNFASLANMWRRAKTILQEFSKESDDWIEDSRTGMCSVAFQACSVAYRQINIRHICLGTGNPTDPYMHMSTPIQLDDLGSELFRSEMGSIRFWNFVCVVGKCCSQVLDGEFLFRFVQLVIVSKLQGKTQRLLRRSINEDRPVGASNDLVQVAFAKAISCLVKAGQIPTVRVINLKRRRDRFVAFVSQARNQQISFVRAGVNWECNLVNEDLSIDRDDCYFWGRFAFDGRGDPTEVDQRLSKEMGVRSSSVVGTRWRPNDLKAFDTKARDDEKMVMMSPTERACALSHIASWKGVERSLGYMNQDPCNFLRLFRISGFARGPALLVENEKSPPAPVCVILEDDAILVDRFRDRLAAVLEELPRDFHFCSLGYSRPRTAPMMRYSSQLGIPSCLWYLTGYLLSLEGAKHLLKSLPVEGPVDSWVGLKMCANWENTYGRSMGVGVRSRPVADPIPRKELSKFLKFRAFAVLVPLCSQKVGADASTTSNRAWRQRDTDVVFSGS